MTSKLLFPIAFAALAACGRPSGASTQQSYAAPAAAEEGSAGASGLTSPDVILGRWRGTGDPTSCPNTELIVTRSIFTRVRNGQASQDQVLGIAWGRAELHEVSITAGDITNYLFSDPNNMQLETSYTQCPYTREG